MQTPKEKFLEKCEEDIKDGIHYYKHDKRVFLEDMSLIADWFLTQIDEAIENSLVDGSEINYEESNKAAGYNQALYDLRTLLGIKK